MTSTQQHWTEADVESFAYRVAFDFTTFVRNILASGQVSQSDLAGRLGVTEGRVSQILNNPGNLTLKQIVKIARALRRKVAVIEYDDGDADNADGPINAGVFVECWERAGKPRDYFASQAMSEGFTDGTLVAIAQGTLVAASGTIATSETSIATTAATTEYDDPSVLFSTVMIPAPMPRANVSMSSTGRNHVPVIGLRIRPN